MHLLLIEPDTKSIAPNLALLKWATWAEENNHTYQYIIGKKEFLKKEPDIILMSCIFSFYSEAYKKLIHHYHFLFPKARFLVGGAFPTLNPKWFKENFPYTEVHEGTHPDIEDLSPKYSIIRRELISLDILKQDVLKSPDNKQLKKQLSSDIRKDWSRKIIGYASRGCVNACKYCAVSKLEGKMRSFPTIKPMLEKGIKEIKNPTGVVLYDNNFTAHEYFDNICDELEECKLPVDIHGLHVSDFTEHHAERFARLKWGAQHEAGTAYMRFSFDFVGYQPHIHRALKLVEKHKIKAAFFCYMLFNWVDSPDDFWKRIVQAQEMTDDVGRTIFLFPQRFEPLDSLERNKFVGTKWDKELVAGVVKLYTFMHGFLPVTTSHNIFNWIGYTKEEFFDNARKFATDKTFKLVKKEGVAPKTFKL